LNVKTNQVYPLHGEHLQRVECIMQGSLFCFEHPMCVLPELVSKMSRGTFRFIKLQNNNKMIYHSLLYVHGSIFVTCLSLSVRVGRSIRIWETCKVYNDPESVASFFMTQVTSSPSTLLTCIAKHILIVNII
jgi:hypothetical protein